MANDGQHLPLEPGLSSIEVERREGRSTPTAGLQKVINAFSSLIMKPAKPFPAGSPQITPPSSAHKGCEIREYQVEDIWIYGFSRQETAADEDTKITGRQLYYFSGGGFRGAPTKEHWLLCAELCRELPEYNVNLVSYPLAPNSPASSSIPQLYGLYRTLAKETIWSKSRITFMGDSAGGNIALVLGLYGASEFVTEGTSGACPIGNIFTISPAVDHRNRNPEIDELDHKDPILSRKVIEEVSDIWKGDWSFEDPRLSPTLADLSLFKQCRIEVDGVLGMNDVLTPDAIIFREKLAAAGVKGKWLEWEKQMHVFPIMFSYHIREAVAAKDWIVDVLKLRANSVDL